MLILNKNKIEYLKKFDLSKSIIRCQECPMNNDLFMAFLKENKANKYTLDYFKNSSCLIRFSFLISFASVEIDLVDDCCRNRIKTLQDIVDNCNVKPSIIENE